MPSFKLLRFVRDAVDFDSHHRIRELRFHRSSRGLLVTEKLGVDFVHLLELAAVF